MTICDWAVWQVCVLCIWLSFVTCVFTFCLFGYLEERHNEKEDERKRMAQLEKNSLAWMRHKAELDAGRLVCMKVEKNEAVP